MLTDFAKFHRKDKGVPKEQDIKAKNIDHLRRYPQGRSNSQEEVLLDDFPKLDFEVDLNNVDAFDGHGGVAHVILMNTAVAARIGLLHLF